MRSRTTIAEALNTISRRLPKGGTGRQMIQSFSGSFVVQMINLPLTLVTGVVLARSLGPSSYGYYALALAWLEFLKVPVAYGHPQFVQREIAVNGSLGRWDLVRGIIVRMNQSVVSAAVLICVAIILAIEVFHVGLFGGATQARVFEIAVIMLPVIGASSVRTAALNGLHHPVASVIPDNICRPAFALTLIVVLQIGFGLGLTPDMAMMAQGAAIFSAFLVGLFLYRRYSPPAVRTASAVFQTGDWARQVWPFMLTGGAYAFWGTLGLLMLGWYRSPAEVGIFRVTSLLAGLALVPITITNTIIAPNIARLYAQKDIPGLQKLISVATLLIFLVLAFIFVCAALVGKFALVTVFGSSYESSYPALLILVGGHLLYSSIWTVLICLENTRNQKFSLYALITSALMNLALAATLIPRFGAIGAAVSTSLSWFLGHLWLVPVVRKRIGIKPTVFAAGSFIRAR